MQTRRIETAWLVLIGLGLSACGGGGGGSTSAPSAAAAPVTAPNPAPAPAPAASAATVVELLPGSSMAWSTDGQLNVQLALSRANGQPAAGAALRVFTLSRLSPQDGSTLEQPVPVSLLESAATDAAGRIAWTLRMPGEQTELLLVATLDDEQGQWVLSSAAASPQTLQLSK
ncbi:hypothetical protein WG899_15485 [Paucibacter sp. AS339]|uniref:hypothetical protein n=1 Tax=Paucibacter hankyongi TaxID=3133434 RepID=UPI0030A003C7